MVDIRVRVLASVSEKSRPHTSYIHINNKGAKEAEQQQLWAMQANLTTQHYAFSMCMEGINEWINK